MLSHKNLKAMREKKPFSDSKNTQVTNSSDNTSNSFTISLPAKMNVQFDWPPSSPIEQLQPLRAKSMKNVSAPLKPNSSNTSSNGDQWSAFGAYTPSILQRLPDQAFPEESSRMHLLLHTTSTPLIWDVRDRLSTVAIARSAATYHTSDTLSLPMLSNSANHIRIVSKEFPWAFDIGPKSYPISCSDALYYLHAILHKPLEDAIWGAVDNSKRDSILKAWRRRAGPKPLNVDWLGKDVMFRGFLKDDSFTEKRLHPAVDDVAETWLVTFGKE